mmetsp:Transcript_38483/g.53426  ORF Transcript_38483/g.53426 Transcript_38483/m.53426 type:complete len:624 (+) Transcript_38483:25-1896(+)|eukprot:CAMPEP_0196576316 /NCGR_PEP_ID=MMETSP1081-20130531/5610_1 /TAXON_ID=36882 /ORGANISM="Pyramimonas amylifera, Strain CCMP720" /LENGTH=623 /DNA_ID=CAMNT_0041894893 /DNA_START=25 /DNA_END=1899 /DNA_ORIENTATION=-
METIDANTRRVASEAVRICRERKIQVSGTVLAFVARSLAVHDPAAFQLENQLPSAATRALAEATVDRVASLEESALDSIRMEVQVEREYMSQGQQLQEETQAQEEDAMSQEFGITSARYKPDRDDAEFFTQLYRKIFTYVASAPGLEAALQNPEAESETVAALDSVFPQHGLRRFLSLTREDKAAQVRELRSIVLGIRIFNASIGKGGLGIQDPAPPFQAQAYNLLQTLKTLIVDAQQELAQYEVVVEAKASHLRPSEAPLPKLRAELSNRLVFLDLAHFLLEQVEKGIASVTGMSTQYQQEMQAVQALVGARQAVAKEKVYPKLEALGALHGLLLQERRMLVVLQRVTDVLEPFKASYVPSLSMKDIQEAQATPPLGALISDLGPATPPDPLAAAKGTGATLLLWDEACEENELPALRCGGFSVVTAVKRGGLLVRASPEVSVVQWSGGLYGFVSEEEAEAFAANPSDYLAALVSQVVPVIPELVRLLRLEDSLPTLRMSAVVELMSQPISCDFGTQTPTHFIEKHIDRNYEWNEWAIRRRVLQLTNLRQKCTHSQQTHLSHFRRDQEAQMWLPKTSFTQTAVQKGTTMPQKKMYIEGLRGPPDVRMNVVNVDLNMGQPHEY